MKPKILLYSAVAIGWLFHISGIIGLLQPQTQSWFLNNTPVNLSISAIFLAVLHQPINKQFFWFLISCYLIGFTAEVIGVNTSLLFGQYNYGKPFGIQWLQVPISIGLLWWTTAYCCCNLTHSISMYVQKKWLSSEVNPNQKLIALSFILDAALLTTLFDVVIEPVAIKLGFWVWFTANGVPPLYNYICWFAISLLLSYLYKRWQWQSSNQFAKHLLVMQAVFFLILNLWL